jgi:2-polyprenyl-6-methoxyphenol hydroxylase-like FAD-dependent oxidoreductase
VVETPVLIVGGGPAGATLAAELGFRGASCLLVEQNAGENPHPRANMAGQRTMEIFRRWGLADKVLNASLPKDYPVNVVFSTRLNGQELHRFSLPSIAEFQNPESHLRAELPDVDYSPYFKTQIGQNFLEPVIREFAASFPGVQVRQGWKLGEFSQDKEGIVAQIINTASGARETVKARYLVGCDGGRSMVRKSLGVGFEGRGALSKNWGIYARIPHFFGTHPLGRGTLLWTLAPDVRGVFIAIDGKDLWTYNRYFCSDEDAQDPKHMIRQAIGRDVPVEILSVQPWTGFQVVAAKYRVGRAFLCGDSAHLFNPTGGFGMNTAIADAADLGWKLAAVLAGWGGERLLESYELERRPVGVRNTTEAAANFDKIAALMKLPSELSDDSEAGRTLRQQVGQRLSGQKKTWSASGMHLGYTYEGSPVIVPDGTPAPVDHPQFYRPTSRPGSRAPHVWLSEDVSTLDLVPRQGFALLRFGGAPALESLRAAAAKAEVPYAEIEVDSDEAKRVYEKRYVLVRPDGHVAWRSDSGPLNAADIIATVSGTVG